MPAAADKTKTAAPKAAAKKTAKPAPKAAAKPVKAAAKEAVPEYYETGDRFKRFATSNPGYDASGETVKVREQISKDKYALKDKGVTAANEELVAFARLIKTKVPSDITALSANHIHEAVRALFGEGRLIEKDPKREMKLTRRKVQKLLMAVFGEGVRVTDAPTVAFQAYLEAHVESVMWNARLITYRFGGEQVNGNAVRSAGESIRSI